MTGEFIIEIEITPETELGPIHRLMVSVRGDLAGQAVWNKEDLTDTGTNRRTAQFKVAGLPLYLIMTQDPALLSYAWLQSRESGGEGQLTNAGVINVEIDDRYDVSRQGDTDVGNVLCAADNGLFEISVGSPNMVDDGVALWTYTSSFVMEYAFMDFDADSMRVEVT